MADGDTAQTLVSGFPPAERADWLALAGDLSRLRSTTYEGIPVEPLYTADDDVFDPGLPGFPPYVRGRTAAGRRAGWDVRQIVRADQGRGAGAAELEHGATSLWVQLDASAVADGMLGDLLDGVMLDAAPVVLDAGRSWWPAAQALSALWAGRGADADAVHGSLGADPYGTWAADRRHVDLDGDLKALADAATGLAAGHRHVRVATVDGTRFHDSGASDAQELGLAVAALVATVRALGDAGDGDLAAAFGRVELRLAASVDQFATVAKFRAARRLLALVAEVAGEPTAAAAVPLHAVTSRAMATSYDAAVNMLRATIACFAAGVGGADAITVHPYDELTAPTGTRLGRRLARNTQLVLALESNLAKVLDPAGGSWYVERRTEQLAERAWDVVREIEGTGGFRAAVETGVVARCIAETRSHRTEDVDHRRAPMVGVTVFPDVAAPAPPPTTCADGDLPVRRWAEDFEALRRRVDTAPGSGAREHVAAAGRRPAVFLAAFGAPAACAPRLASAANFFAIAGLETPRGPAAADVAAIATAFAESGAPVACVCADDGTEQARGDELGDALTAAGATRVYSAAQLGGDVRAELADLLDHVGIP